jgi:hypothetical protein
MVRRRESAVSDDEATIFPLILRDARKGALLRMRQLCRAASMATPLAIRRIEPILGRRRVREHRARI